MTVPHHPTTGEQDIAPDASVDELPDTSVAELVMGPVSTALEQALRRQVRRHGIVIWLDTSAHYTGLLATLARARALPYHVHTFAGSFLELMLALAPSTGGIEPPRCVIHMPGFSHNTIENTPLLELYRAGHRFERRLDTTVRETAAGRVPPDRIDAFLAGSSAAPGLSLDAADAWLTKQLHSPAGGLAGVLAAMSPLALVDDLQRGRGVADQLRLPADHATLHTHLAGALGLARDWWARTCKQPSARNAAYAAASWAMAVEYVDDLQRPPLTERLAPATNLPAAVVTACRELAEHLRVASPDFYEQTALATETDLLAVEAREASAADLGVIDTFLFEDEQTIVEAIAALDSGQWAAADTWARRRLAGDGKRGSFWLERRLARKSEWQLVAACATLGLAIDSAGPSLSTSARTVDAAAERYAQVGAAVDHAHRHLEQLRHALLYGQLDRFADLRSVLDQMREHWRAWADTWARDFSQLCRQHGFLPGPALQQRQLFEDVVRPLADDSAGARTAYFVVDALRYEMGQELHRKIADTPATDARLTYRLAELPSNTEVGMNVLAPVASRGRLAPALRNDKIVGFATGEFRVDRPKTRQRAMHTRVGGDACPWLPLDKVLDSDARKLKNTVSKARLVVVHIEEIDKIGERDAGPRVFAQILRQLRKAWQLLRDAGVKHFVITADHGFLLLHDRQENAQRHGRNIDPHRRHVLSRQGADHAGEVRVPLSQLKYDGVEDWHLMCPETTAAFATGSRGGGFVHGGNSLQERMIPVLTVVHRAASGGSPVRYRIAGRHEPGIAGMHCVALEVSFVGQNQLPFARDAEIELALRVSEHPGVRLDLIQARQGARVEGTSVYAPVGREFEVFFRLHGRTDARVRVEVFHPGASQVEGYTVAERFAVASDGSKRPETASETVSASETESASASESASTSTSAPTWLDELPDGAVRALFAHLAEHGTVSEGEATRMFGGARKLRRFSARFEEYAALVPFSVRIENVAGVKTYVREGAAP